MRDRDASCLNIVFVKWKGYRMKKNKNNIFITENDRKRLNELIKAIENEKLKNNSYIEQLKKELERAKIVPPNKISGEVVTVNSRILLEDMVTNEEFSYQVVFPSNADLEAGKISILAPVGIALLGYKVGDIITWEVPGGVRKLKIKEMVYQPEAEGDYDL